MNPAKSPASSLLIALLALGGASCSSGSDDTATSTTPPPSDTLQLSGDWNFETEVSSKTGDGILCALTKVGETGRTNLSFAQTGTSIKVKDRDDPAKAEQVWTLTNNNTLTYEKTTSSGSTTSTQTITGTVTGTTFNGSTVNVLKTSSTECRVVIRLRGTKVQAAKMDEGEAPPPAIIIFDDNTVEYGAVHPGDK